MILRSLTLFLCGAAALVGQNIDGEWVATMKFFDNVEYLRMTLHLQGDKITGKAGDIDLTGTFATARSRSRARLSAAAPQPSRERSRTA